MDALLHILIAWIVAVLTVSNTLFLWFKTNLAGEIMRVARNAGWHKQDESFWAEDYETRMRHEWVTWASMHVASGRLPRFWVHLLTCPGCLSVWLTAAYTSALGVALYAEGMLPVLGVVYYILLCLHTVPLLSNKLSA